LHKYISILFITQSIDGVSMFMYVILYTYTFIKNAMTIFEGYTGCDNFCIRIKLKILVIN